MLPYLYITYIYIRTSQIEPQTSPSHFFPNSKSQTMASLKFTFLQVLVIFYTIIKHCESNSTAMPPKILAPHHNSPIPTSSSYRPGSGPKQESTSPKQELTSPSYNPGPGSKHVPISPSYHPSPGLKQIPTSPSYHLGPCPKQEPISPSYHPHLSLKCWSILILIS